MMEKNRASRRMVGRVKLAGVPWQASIAATIWGSRLTPPRACFDAAIFFCELPSVHLLEAVTPSPAWHLFRGMYVFVAHNPNRQTTF